ncbi:TPA: hypothetical protein DCZ46_00705 [Candidatus Campbellbacteria bacterium]|nr:MAG: hypothetical protein UR74_C0001G0249 [Candidatus Campbellbacteria bacterium GW2011_GWD2_35_24]KKP76046.1 MAG: hypothetical protein UR75_C0001G0080 [Candidatus Campbellbacteria bacterium GW2011_GWC2_35_28]KKP77235.1 MAG: hypothetical protein UR76_C0001G0080 [Candidatus Campbellbacteria bacterium GW2011_GWC1_35_31]KKP79164.1 MAG: hypothetical protein UR79_C0001G0080 [Candidatus Campbellbacteria bacterium GW2011_GWD1_35_49]HBC70472.1 hypothetical protein [Candidatus Campbellbacteria bacter
MMPKKPLRRLKSINFITLVCGPRGRTFSFTVPIFGDPTLTVYEKASRVFEKMTNGDDDVIILSDLNDFLAFVEETDFQSSEESLSDWN